MALHWLRMFWKQCLFIGEGRGPSLPGAAWLRGKRVLQWGAVALQYPGQGSRGEWGRCGLLFWVFSVILKLVLLSPCPSVRGSAALFCPLPAPCYWREWGGGAVLRWSWRWSCRAICTVVASPRFFGDVLGCGQERCGYESVGDRAEC